MQETEAVLETIFAILVNTAEDFPLTPALSPVGGEGESLSYKALLKPQLPLSRLDLAGQGRHDYRGRKGGGGELAVSSSAVSSEE